jgi:hypothetical protein
MSVCCLSGTMRFNAHRFLFSPHPIIHPFGPPLTVAQSHLTHGRPVPSPTAYAAVSPSKIYARIHPVSVTFRRFLQPPAVTCAQSVCLRRCPPPPHLGAASYTTVICGVIPQTSATTLSRPLLAIPSNTCIAGRELVLARTFAFASVHDSHGGCTSACMAW